MANDSTENNVPINRPVPPPPPIPPKVPPAPKSAAKPNPEPTPPPPTPATVPSMAVLPPVPIPTPPVPAANVDTSKVVVRTMRDDFTDAKQGKATPRPANPSPVSPPPAPSPSPPASAFPLPPRASDKPAKTVSSPGTYRQGSKAMRWALIALLVVLVLASAGAAAWFFVVGDILPENSPARSVTDVKDVLPANYLMMVRYQLQSAQDRSTLTNAWQSARGGQPTIRELLTGDPRLLLADPDLTEIYFVLLEDSTDPFVVAPKTALTTQHVVTSNGARFIERDGWYIAHAATVQPYETALAQGTLSVAGNGQSFTDPTASVPMQISLGAGILPTIRTSLVSPDFVAGQLQGGTIAVTLGQQPTVLPLRGLADYFNPPAATLTNQELLSYVPAQATGVRLGANFKDDVAAWLALANVLDKNTLQRPVVKQLLDQLTTPYAFMAFPSPAGASKPALGLVIELPLVLKGKVTLQESALEQGVPALIPLILDRRTVAPVSFTEVAATPIPLRYANISGTSAALDYAVTDQHIIIATSKDSMLALLAAVGGNALGTPAPTAWDELLTKWGALPAAHDIFLGNLTTPALLNLLPTAPATGMPFGVAFSTAPDVAGNHATLSGVISTVSALSSSPTVRP